MPVTDERHFNSSVHREKLVEHLFLGELLRHFWVTGAGNLDVLKPEVDRAGYDVVLEKDHIARHVQLKTSIKKSRDTSVSINTELASHPSGCVIWIVVNDKLEFQQFLWFGAAPGLSLPDLSKFKQARHTRANARGIKSERLNTKVIPKSGFRTVLGMREISEILFGKNAH
jgi:hypothetical protein